MKVDFNTLIRSHIARLYTISAAKITAVHTNGTADVQLDPVPQDASGKTLSAQKLKNIRLWVGFGGVQSPIQAGQGCLLFHTKHDPSEFNKNQTPTTLASAMTFQVNYAFALVGFWTDEMPQVLTLTDDQQIKLSAPTVEVKNDMSNLIPDLIDAIDKLKTACMSIVVETPQGAGTGKIVPAAVDAVLEKLRSFTS